MYSNALPLQSHLYENIQSTVLQPKYVRRALLFSRFTGWLAIVTGVVVLLGWLFDVRILIHIYPEWASMKAITALCLCLGGASLLLLYHTSRTTLKKRVAQAMLFLLFLSGILSLVVHAIHLFDPLASTFSVDNFLIMKEPSVQEQSIFLPMAPFTSVLSCLLALCLWSSVRIRTRKKPIWYQIPARTGIFLCCAILFTYLFGIQSAHYTNPFANVAVHTALVFLLLFVGSLLVHPSRGLTGLLVSSRPGGLLLRRLLPLTLFMFFVVFSLTLLGHRQGFYSYESAFAIAAALGMLLFTVAIINIAWQLQRADQKREKTDIELMINLLREKTLREDLQILNQHQEQLNEELAVQDESLRRTNDNLGKTLQILEEKNFELDQFVYRISHDLRSPLTTILGLINLMAIEEDNEQLRQYTSLIENRVHKLDEFIKEMLTYSRNARTSTNIQLIDFEIIIQECLADLQYIPPFEQVEKSWTITGGVPFCSDAFRLKIIFMNLLSNAIKYAHPDRRKRLDISIMITDNEATIVLYDNGIGIREESLSKVFNMFYRATSVSQGSGLGMYIVKQSIDKLSGTISIQSQLGKFTRIQITVPNCNKVPYSENCR